jgi:hypothetical protein
MYPGDGRRRPTQKATFGSMQGRMIAVDQASRNQQSGVTATNSRRIQEHSLDADAICDDAKGD